MDTPLNIRGIRRERAALRERRNTGKSKLSAQAAYEAAEKRKVKEFKRQVTR